MNWTDVENAIHSWVVAGSGLAANQVIWSQQEGPRPAGAFVSLRVSSLRAVGQDWNDVVDISNPEPGAEIELRTRGVRELALSIQCFAGAGIGATSALAVIGGIVDAAGTLSRRDALNAAGIGVLSLGPATSIDGILGASFEPRAILEARLALASELSEAATYIQSAEVINDETDASFIAGVFGPLAPPEVVLAEAGDGRVTVMWTESPGAESYNLYVGESSGVTISTGTKLEDVVSPHEHTGLNNGTTYYYVVTAVNGRLGESIESDEASATPEA